MVSRILVDTNVLLDYLLTREPFYEDAKAVVLTCTEGEIKACIAAHSIPNMFFILGSGFIKESIGSANGRNYSSEGAFFVSCCVLWISSTVL